MGFCVFKEGDNMKQPTDLTDKRFGKLVVKSYYDTANSKHRGYACVTARTPAWQLQAI